LATAAGLLPYDVETVGQVGDRLLEAVVDGGEVPFIDADQVRVRFRGEVAGEIERAESQDCSSFLKVSSFWRPRVF